MKKAMIFLVSLVTFASQGFAQQTAPTFPSAGTKTYQGQGISFQYPDDWQLAEAGGQLTIAPVSAHKQMPNGTEWITLGMFVGQMTMGTTLETTADELLRRMSQGNPGLQSSGDRQLVSVSGRPALRTGYRNSQPDGAYTEQGLLLTVDYGTRAWYWVMFWPSDEVKVWTPVFERVAESIRFDRPPISPSTQSVVDIEPSITLIRTTIVVPAGQFLSYNFGLNRGSTLNARFQVAGGTNDTINVWLVDASNYQRLVGGQQFSYFRGTSGSVRGVAQYTFQIPSTSLYYIVLDNRNAWLLPRKVGLYVYALVPEAPLQNQEIRKLFDTFYQALKGAFVFSDFKISMRHCGQENAFSDPNITVCTELIEVIADKRLEGALSFVFFHELGHSLLRMWGLPLWDNEDAADEFATMFTIMGRQQGAALQAAQWWASQTSEAEALSKVWLDDRHSVSPQRARNIIRWLNQDDELVRRWYRILIPNMQTQALSSLLQDADPRVDKELVRAELRKRSVTPSN